MRVTRRERSRRLFSRVRRNVCFDCGFAVGREFAGDVVAFSAVWNGGGSRMNSGLQVSLAAAAQDAAAGPVTLFALVCGMSFGWVLAVTMFRIWNGGDGI